MTLSEVLDICHATALEPPGGMVDGTKYWEAVNSYVIGTDNELSEGTPASDQDAALMELQRDRERRREMARQLREEADGASEPQNNDGVG